MARKTKSGRASGPSSDESLGQAVVDSAQRIWLAGLGAFARPKTEGDKMFEVLVEQGKKLRDRARGAADEALKTVRAQTEATVSQAQGEWDKLEQVFEDRVSRSLTRLGVLTTRDVDLLARQVKELNESVRSLMSGPEKSGARAKTARKRTKRTGGVSRG